MTREIYTGVIVLFIAALASCNGHVHTDAPKENNSATKQPKILKNHFIDFPEDYFYVQCGLQDKKGKMWFGSAGNGIYVFDGDSFINFTHKSYVNFALKEDLNHNDVLCCMEDNTGNIWFGTRRGLIRYKPSDARPDGKDFSLFLIPANTITDSSRTRRPYTFKTGDNFVWSIMQDKSGTIWIGTGKGIYVHNPATDNDKDGPMFRCFLNDDNIINDKQLQLKDISVMLQDRNNNIWFASAWAKSEGIVRYDGRSLVNFTPDSVYAFRSILERKNGDLLFLSPFNGVYSYDARLDDSVGQERVFTNISEKIGLKSDTLFCMMEDKNENLWFGINRTNMKDGGVWRYDGNSLKLFTTKDGLSHNCCWCIVEDNAGNIWFGTRNTGLCQYDGRSFTDFTE